MLCFYYQVCSFSNFLCDLLYGLCRGTVLNFQIYWNFLVICCCWFEFKEWSSHKIHSMRWQFFDIYQDFFHDLPHRKSCLMPHVPWKECGFYSYLVCSSVNENKIKLANCSNLLYLHWFFFQIFILNIEKGMLNSPTVIVNLSVSQFNFFSFCFMSTWSFNTKGTCIVKYYFSQWMNLNISVYYFFPCLIFIPALIYSNGLYLLFYILGLTVLRSGLRGSK